MLRRLITAFTLAIAACALTLLLVMPAAQAAPVPEPQAPNASAIRISQVYGGGGNSGAPYRYDFVELFNAGTTVVDMDHKLVS